MVREILLAKEAGRVLLTQPRLFTLALLLFRSRGKGLRNVAPGAKPPAQQTAAWDYTNCCNTILSFPPLFQKVQNPDPNKLHNAPKSCSRQQTSTKKAEEPNSAKTHKWPMWFCYSCFNVQMHNFDTWTLRAIFFEPMPCALEAQTVIKTFCLWLAIPTYWRIGEKESKVSTETNKQNKQNTATKHKQKKRKRKNTACYSTDELLYQNRCQKITSTLNTDNPLCHWLPATPFQTVQNPDAFWTEYFSPIGFSAAFLRWRLLNWIFFTPRFQLQFCDGAVWSEHFSPRDFLPAVLRWHLKSWVFIRSFFTCSFRMGPC